MKGHTAVYFGEFFGTFLLAIDFGLLKVGEVMEVIERKSSELHLVLTGRHAPRRLVEAADLVTEMKEIKHHYGKGMKGQVGIEF